MELTVPEILISGVRPGPEERQLEDVKHLCEVVGCTGRGQGSRFMWG